MREKSFQTLLMCDSSSVNLSCYVDGYACVYVHLEREIGAVCATGERITSPVIGNTILSAYFAIVYILAILLPPAVHV